MENNMSQTLAKLNKVLDDPNADLGDQLLAAADVFMLGEECRKRKESKIAYAKKCIETQRPIAEHFKFEGCEVVEMDHTWPVFGCSLRWKCPKFEVNIDFEDADTIEQVENFSVQVEDISGEQEVSDEGPNFMYGDFNSIEKVRKLCKLLEQNKLNEASKILN